MSRLLDALRTIEDKGLAESDALLIKEEPVDVEQEPRSRFSSEPREEVAREEKSILSDPPLETTQEEALQCQSVAEIIEEEETAACVIEQPLCVAIPSSLDLPINQSDLSEEEGYEPLADEEGEVSASSRESAISSISHVEQICNEELDPQAIIASLSGASLIINEEAAPPIIAAKEVKEEVVVQEGVIDKEEEQPDISPESSVPELEEEPPPAKSTPSSTSRSSRPITIPVEWEGHHPQLLESASGMLSLLPPSLEIPTWMMVGIDKPDRRLPWLIAQAIACSQQLKGFLLLVDGDLIGQHLSRRLKVEDRPGLTEIMCGESNLESLLIPTSLERLWVLPAGNAPASKGDASVAISTILERSADRFAGIMVDGGTSFSSLQEEASHSKRETIPCENIILDTRLGESTALQIQQRIESLDAQGIDLRGCIAF